MFTRAQVRSPEFIRFFSTGAHTSQLKIKLNETLNIKITISSLTPYENAKVLSVNGKNQVNDWENDTKRINLDIKANRYDFIGLGIGPLDLKLIEDISRVDSSNRTKTSKNRMAVATFGHFLPIIEQINSLQLSFGDIGRNKICEMCSFGEATRESPRELFYFFHHIAITRNRDRSIKNWSAAIKDTMPTFYSAIVTGNANYIAYNIHKLLKYRSFPNVNNCGAVYNILLIVEQPSFYTVSEILENNLQQWLDNNVVFDEEIKKLTRTRAAGWYFFFAYGVIAPIIVASLTSAYILVTTVRNYKKDGIVSISGRIDQINHSEKIDQDALVINAEYLRDTRCKAFSRKERREREVIWDYPYKSLFKQSRSLERD